MGHSSLRSRGYPKASRDHVGDSSQTVVPWVAGKATLDRRSKDGCHRTLYMRQFWAVKTTTYAAIPSRAFRMKLSFGITLLSLMVFVDALAIHGRGK